MPRKFHGQRSLVSYSPWGHKELDMAEWLSTHKRDTVLIRSHTVFPSLLSLDNWIVWHEVFCAWILVPSIMFQSSFMCSMCLYLIPFLTEKYYIVWLYQILFISSSVTFIWVISSFWLLWVMLLWTFTYEHEHSFVFLGYVPMTEIVSTAWLYLERTIVTYLVFHLLA